MFWRDRFGGLESEGWRCSEGARWKDGWGADGLVMVYVAKQPNRKGAMGGIL